MIPTERKKLLLYTAIDLSVRFGYKYLTRTKVAKKAGVTDALINHYFGTMKNLKKAVLREAIDKEIIPVVAQGLALRDPLALKISKTLKDKTLKYITE
jgi:AcrR family transcriptional regulator